MPDDKKNLGVLCRLDHGIAVFQGQRHRLFDDDVFACPGCKNRMFAVQLMRGRDINDINI
ncbi:hypothetical protein JI59_04215 [Novosphingobium pentaromativorans US6-1]|nr:hypothetical protein JI59_04215 [Novosphingobium pentaromativorans US6-1]